MFLREICIVYTRCRWGRSSLSGDMNRKRWSTSLTFPLPFDEYSITIRDTRAIVDVYSSSGESKGSQKEIGTDSMTCVFTGLLIVESSNYPPKCWGENKVCGKHPSWRTMGLKNLLMRVQISSGWIRWVFAHSRIVFGCSCEIMSSMYTTFNLLFVFSQLRLKYFFFTFKV